MMMMDVSKLSVEYLKLVEENFTYEMNQLKYKMNYIKNDPVVSELFIKLKYIKPKKVQFQEPPIEEDKVELKVHPCADMIKEAIVQGFDDYFDTSYFIEPCQEKDYGYMFKINDKREYYWNQLFPNKLYYDSPSTGIEETPVVEEPTVYAYQYGANEIHKIIDTLDDTHLKVENHRGFDYQRHPDKNGYTMSFSK